MRIAYLNPQPVPDVLPSTLQILQTVDALGAAGATVEVVTPTPRPGAPDAAALLGRALHPQVQLVHLPDLRKRWFFPFASHRLFYWQARRWVRRARPDVVYVRNLKLAESLLDARLGIPLVMETHELFAQSFIEAHGTARSRRHAALAAREARVYREAAALVVITQALLDDIRARFHIDTPARVAADGVDLVLAARAGTPTPHAVPRLLYLGSLHPWKGVDTLIAAMAAVEGAELWVAGGGDARIAQLTAHAQALGCASRIRFLGAVPPVERFALIAQTDICLLPLTHTSIASRYTSPLKLFEYMAMGRAIICADNPALREVVRHGDTAWLVPPESPEALAQAINHLLAQPALCAALGAAAQAAAPAYAWSARAATILALLEEVGGAR